MRKINKNFNNSFIVLGISFFIYSGKDGSNQIVKIFFYLYLFIKGPLLLLFAYFCLTKNVKKILLNYQDSYKFIIIVLWII